MGSLIGGEGDPQRASEDAGGVQGARRGGLSLRNR